MVEPHPVSHIVLLKLWLPLPGCVPEAPPNAGEDCAEADGDEPSDEDHLDPVDHVEGVHVD